MIGREFLFCLFRAPIHIAVIKKNPQFLRMLIDYGADTNLQDNDGWTPLHWAVSESIGLDIVEMLLKAKADPNLPDYEGNTPYQLAEASNNKELTDLFHSCSQNQPQHMAGMCSFLGFCRFGLNTT